MRVSRNRFVLGARDPGAAWSCSCWALSSRNECSPTGGALPLQSPVAAAATPGPAPAEAPKDSPSLVTARRPGRGGDRADGCTAHGLRSRLAAPKRDLPRRRRRREFFARRPSGTGRSCSRLHGRWRSRSSVPGRPPRSHPNWPRRIERARHADGHFRGKTSPGREGSRPRLPPPAIRAIGEVTSCATSARAAAIDFANGNQANAVLLLRRAAAPNGVLNRGARLRARGAGRRTPAQDREAGWQLGLVFGDIRGDGRRSSTARSSATPATPASSPPAPCSSATGDKREEPGRRRGAACDAAAGSYPIACDLAREPRADRRLRSGRGDRLGRMRPRPLAWSLPLATPPAARAPPLARETSRAATGLGR